MLKAESILKRLPKASMGDFDLERPLKSCEFKFEKSFKVKFLQRSWKDPSGSFPGTSLTEHTVGWGAGILPELGDSENRLEN